MATSFFELISIKWHRDLWLQRKYWLLLGTYSEHQHLLFVCFSNLASFLGVDLSLSVKECFDRHTHHLYQALVRLQLLLRLCILKVLNKISERELLCELHLCFQCAIGSGPSLFHVCAVHQEIANARLKSIYLCWIYYLNFILRSYLLLWYLYCHSSWDHCYQEYEIHQRHQFQLHLRIHLREHRDRIGPHHPYHIADILH